MQWVKAIDRLPKSGTPVFLKIMGTRNTGYYSRLRDMFVSDYGDFFPADQIEWLDESTDAAYAIEVPQNKLYQLYTKEQIINAHMAGQRIAGIDPSYSEALAYYEQEKKEAPNPKCEHTYVDVAGWSQCSKCGDVFY